MNTHLSSTQVSLLHVIEPSDHSVSNHLLLPGCSRLRLEHPAYRRDLYKSLLSGRFRLAVIVAACTGAFGGIIQILATLLVTLIVIPIALMLMMGAPGIGLIWCCQQLAELFGRNDDEIGHRR